MPVKRLTKAGKGTKLVDERRCDAYLTCGWTEVGEEVPLTTDEDTRVPEATQEEVDAARPVDPADKDDDEEG